MKLFFATAVAVFLLAMGAGAEKTIHQIDPVVVTASTMEEKKADVPTNVSIINYLTEYTDEENHTDLMYVPRWTTSHGIEYARPGLCCQTQLRG